MNQPKQHTGDKTRFYNADGERVDKVKGADGKTDVRPDVRHARKLPIFISVTTLTGLYDTKGFEDHNIREALLASLNIDRRDHEEEEVYIGRLMDEAKARKSLLMDRGTLIHAEVESAFATGATPFDPVAEKVAKAIKEYLGETPEAEVSFGNSRLCFGGTADIVLRSKPLVMDIKTTSAANVKKTPYFRNVMQLSAYCMGLDLPIEDTMLVNAMVDRVSGDVRFHEWPTARAFDGWLAFRHIHEAWGIDKQVPVSG